MFPSRLRIGLHVGSNLDGAVGACLFTHGTCRALVVANFQSALHGLRILGILHAFKHETSAVTGRDVERGLAVLGILLR